MQLVQDEAHVLIERARAHCGRAKVRVSSICYETDIIHGTRATDASNVARLQKIFELEGCHRLEPENYVPVIVPEATLERALRASNLQQHQLKEYDPKPLKFEPDSLLCLHGKHRLEAAKRHFELSEFEDTWWVVELYREDLSEPTRAVLREEYDNSRNFSDGDIYRYLRHCQGLGDKCGVGKWMARLSKSKRTDILKLERMVAKETPSGPMTKFKDALDKLLPFVGLWAALQIGTFHRVLTLRCPEEMTQYLTLIYNTWLHIVKTEDVALQLDIYTVSVLQGRAPLVSSEDDEFIRMNSDDGLLFPTIQDRQLRADLLDRIRTIPYRIPSLHTFLEDTKYLEPCAKIVKSLLPPDFHGTIFQAFSRIRGRSEVYLELGHEGNSITSRSPANKTLSYLQLWLFAMRHFPEITGVQPRKDTGRPGLSIQGSERYWYHRLGCLASQSGFYSKEITHFSNNDPEPQMIREFLFRVRPKEVFEHNELSIESNVITEIHRSLKALDSIRGSSNSPSDPLYSTDGCTTLELPDRCGRPFGQSFVDDKKFLFLDHIYPHLFNKRQFTPLKDRRRHITSFTVKKDTFVAFFGDLCQEATLDVFGTLPARSGEDVLHGSSSRDAHNINSVPEDLQTEPGLDVSQAPVNEIVGPQTSVPSQITSSEDTEMLMAGNNDNPVPDSQITRTEASFPLQISSTGTSQYNAVQLANNQIMTQQLNLPIQIPLENSLPTTEKRSHQSHNNVPNNNPALALTQSLKPTILTPLEDNLILEESEIKHGWIQNGVLDKMINEIEFLRIWYRFQPPNNTEKPILFYSTEDRRYSLYNATDILGANVSREFGSNFILFVLDIRPGEAQSQNEVDIKNVPLREAGLHADSAGNVLIIQNKAQGSGERKADKLEESLLRK